jgi:hypothetical protein
VLNRENRLEFVQNILNWKYVVRHFKGLVTGGEAEVVDTQEPRCFRPTSERSKTQLLLLEEEALGFSSVLVIINRLNDF